MTPGQIGVTLLARLAVSRKSQELCLGTQMLLRSIIQTERAVRDLGIHVLVLHALDERAKAWYLSLNFGFEVLRDKPMHLYLPIQTIH